MLKLFLEISYSIPTGWRRVLMVAPLIFGEIISLVTMEWPAAAGGAFVSLILFCLPGPSDSEKKGYNF
jgi:hypothetical protein